MSSNREIELGKPSKYLREENPEHSTLAEEIERKHDAITIPKQIVLESLWNEGSKPLASMSMS